MPGVHFSHSINRIGGDHVLVQEFVWILLERCLVLFVVFLLMPQFFRIRLVGKNLDLNHRIVIFKPHSALFFLLGLFLLGLCGDILFRSR